jgi:hypothetical protein
MDREDSFGKFIEVPTPQCILTGSAARPMAPGTQICAVLLGGDQQGGDVPGDPLETVEAG